jgi:hypothetical protein
MSGRSLQALPQRRAKPAACPQEDSPVDLTFCQEMGVLKSTVNPKMSQRWVVG